MTEQDDVPADTREVWAGQKTDFKREMQALLEKSYVGMNLTPEVRGQVEEAVARLVHERFGPPHADRIVSELRFTQHGDQLFVGFGALDKVDPITDPEARAALVRATVEKIKVRALVEEDPATRYGVADGEIELLVDLVFPGQDPLQEFIVFRQATALALSLHRPSLGPTWQACFASRDWEETARRRVTDLLGDYDAMIAYDQASQGEADAAST